VNPLEELLAGDLCSRILVGMKSPTVAIFCVLWALQVAAQPARPHGAQGSPQGPLAQSSRSTIASTSSIPATPAATSKDEESERIRDLTHRIDKIELEMIQKSGTSSGDSVRSAITAAAIGAFAVLVTAMVSFAGQLILLRRDDRRAVFAAERAVELAKQQAVFQHTEKIVEFRLRQMEQFYAPMFALLGQSKGLYDKMLYQLTQDEPQRYKLTAPDPEGFQLHVRAKDGTWKGFRLLDQLPAITSNPKALALVDRIVQIGEQMTKIISEHAGLASEGLIALLGQYLAHYAILSTIYKQGETEPYEPGWHKMGYYPRELDAKIEEGYREVSRFIDQYAQASKQMLAAFPSAADSERS
jgi:hypothetical protein